MGNYSDFELVVAPSRCKAKPASCLDLAKTCLSGPLGRERERWSRTLGGVRRCPHRTRTRPRWADEGRSWASKTGCTSGKGMLSPVRQTSSPRLNFHATLAFYVIVGNVSAWKWATHVRATVTLPADTPHRTRGPEETAFERTRKNIEAN